MTRKCLIIAAGRGSRIEGNGHNVPKPLLPLCGFTLLERNILAAKKVGIKEFYIVLGYRQKEIEQAIDADKLGVSITFIKNDCWTEPNGVSVLKAREHLNGDSFLLLMADHIFHPGILEKLLSQPRSFNETLLAVDRKYSSVFDLDDATKVMVQEDGSICKIGKKLKHFNALDTGIFLCSPVLFDALEEVSKRGSPSLTDGIKELARRNLCRSFPIEGSRDYWQDIDTPEAYQHAEKMLLGACRKETDGIITRHFNRFISLFISRWLVRFPVSANMVTLFLWPIGLSTSLLMAQGTYVSMLLGALLFKAVSILDGVDGEISRLRMQQSSFGGLLDTIADYTTCIAFFIGLFEGLRLRGHVPFYTLTVSMTVVGIILALSVSVIIHWNLFVTSGSLTKVKQAVRLSPIEKYFSHFIERDFFALLFLLAILFNAPETILYMTLIGTHATWITLVVHKVRALSQEREEVKEGLPKEIIP